MKSVPLAAAKLAGAASSSSSVMVSVGVAELRITRVSLMLDVVARLTAMSAASTWLFTAVSVTDAGLAVVLPAVNETVEALSV